MAEQQYHLPLQRHPHYDNTWRLHTDEAARFNELKDVKTMHASLATRKTLHNLSFVLKCHFSDVSASIYWFGFVLFSI